MTRMSFPSRAFALILSTGLALAGANASAQMQMQDHDHHDGAPATTQDASAALSVGEVKKVDKDTGKLTIKHGPLDNLGMGAMTMVFKVGNPAMLDQVKAGDQVRFRAERVDDALTVTRLEPAN